MRPSMLVRAAALSSFVVVTGTQIAGAQAIRGPEGPVRGNRALSPRATLPSSQVRVPLHFERNVGQAGRSGGFVARGGGVDALLTGSGAVLATGGSTMRLRFEGARSVRPAGVHRLRASVNYFVGSRSNWHTDVPVFSAVRYAHLYRGVDLLFHGNRGALEYDFRVARGAAAGSIALAFRGASLRLRADGALVARDGNARLVQPAPTLYQRMDGVREPVVGGYRLLGRHRVGFWVGAHDSSRALVIDPTIVYSSYIGGGNDDYANAVAAGPNGTVVIAGATESFNFPTKSAYQDKNAGTTQDPRDAFVAKFKPGASGKDSLIYSTYLGGADYDEAYGVAVDSKGAAYVTGYAAYNSSDFPTTPGKAYQPTKASGDDAFLSKLSANGKNLPYSTFLGGTGYDQGYGVALDGTNRATITGFTESSNFPVTGNAYQSAKGGDYDAFASIIDTSKSGVASLLYSTFLGGTNYDFGRGIRASGKTLYLTGQAESADFPVTPSAFQGALRGNSDAFVTKLDTSKTGGNQLAYSTFLGGGGYDRARGIARDQDGLVYVTGDANSNRFPVKNAFQSKTTGTDDAFVSKLNPNKSKGKSLVYSTLLGGADDDEAYGIAADGKGHAYVVGYTYSKNFPTNRAVQRHLAGRCPPGYCEDGFVTELSASGRRLLFSTYLGGGLYDDADGVALSKAGIAVAGETYSYNFPTKRAFRKQLKGEYDAFLTVIRGA